LFGASGDSGLVTGEAFFLVGLMGRVDHTSDVCAVPL
jgi:hypothetical protein